jgi:hypothetical protein
MCLEQRTLYWRFNVAGKNKPYFGFYERCPIILSNFHQIWTLLVDRHYSANIRLKINSSSGNRFDVRAKMERQTDGQVEPNRRFTRLFLR